MDASDPHLPDPRGLSPLPPSPLPDDDADLAPPDREGVDALLESGWRPEFVGGLSGLRAERVGRLLSLLDAPIEPDRRETLIDVTLARVARSPTGSAILDDSARLSDADEDAMESLVNAGFRLEAVPTALRARAEKQLRLMRMLEAGVPAEPAGQKTSGPGSNARGLIETTLARVQSAAESQMRGLQMGAEPAITRGGGGFRLTDLISIAAVLVIAGGAVLPMLAQARSYGRQTVCSANMMTAGLGFAQYAGDYRDALPVASASMAGTPWWFVGDKDRSNSANLYRLTATKYAGVRDLACAGNQDACRVSSEAGRDDWARLSQVSYSYQNMFAKHRSAWTTAGSGAESGSVVVLADASPVVRRAFAGEWINPLENSANHAGNGQNVLLNDGRVLWLRTPVLASGDNIWLPREIEDAIQRLQRLDRAEPLRGSESPADGRDAFVGP